jgi:hypothetical protein
MGQDMIWSSHLHRVPGASQVWAPGPGVELEMPVMLDMVITDPVRDVVVSRTEAVVDLVAGHPALISVTLWGRGGLSPDLLQRRFRWSGPLEVVTRIVPRLIHEGVDPFTYDYPTDGFPEITHAPGMRGLTDDFLEDIARRYVQIGRGYSRVLADEYIVSPRTVVSWVEKARRRGILSRTSPGKVGGSVRAAGPGSPTS